MNQLGRQQTSFFTFLGLFLLQCEKLNLDRCSNTQLQTRTLQFVAPSKGSSEPYRVSAPDFHVSRLDCRFWIFRLELKLLLPFHRARQVSNILVGLLTRFNFNRFMSFEAYFPSHMALVFFRFKYKPEHLLNSFTIFKVFFCWSHIRTKEICIVDKLT